MWILLTKQVYSTISSILSINQLFFYTYLKNPLELQSADNNRWQFNNIDGHVDSKGAETNMKNKI
jgi:iron complex outermembrane receptor protein